jgi:hypothetical protein
VDKYAVNAAALKFMACGSIITFHWQLNPFITTCDFSRVCLLLCEFQRVAGLPMKEYFFWFHAESLWSHLHMIQEHVFT